MSSPPLGLPAAPALRLAISLDILSNFAGQISLRPDCREGIVQFPIKAAVRWLYRLRNQL